MIHALVDAAIRIPQAQRRPKFDHIVWTQLRFPNPEFENRVRFGKNTAGVPSHIELVESDGAGGFVVPRGAVDVVKQAAASLGEPVRFEDRRLLCTPVAYAFGLELRDYQEEAVTELCRHVQGCVVLPPGAGKSVIVLGAIARTAQPALIIVNTRELVNQWVGHVRRAFGVEPGVVAEGRVQLGDVTVATIQSLTALDDVTLAAVAARFGCVVADECHHVSSPTFRHVLGRLPAKYRFGVTATPEREDGLDELINLNVGQIVYRLDTQELVALGHLVAPRIEVVHTGHEAHPELDFAGLIAQLTRDVDRNRLIVSLAKREAAAGHAVLTLTGRVDHASVLAHASVGAGMRAAALTSATPKKVREQTLERFKSGEIEAVYATTLADEGLDVTRLARLILATPAKAQGRTMQRLGRLMRPHEGKGQPVLYDLVDDHHIAARQHRERLRAYRALLGAEAKT